MPLLAEGWHKKDICKWMNSGEEVGEIKKSLSKNLIEAI